MSKSNGGGYNSKALLEQSRRTAETRAKNLLAAMKKWKKERPDSDKRDNSQKK